MQLKFFDLLRFAPFKIRGDSYSFGLLGDAEQGKEGEVRLGLNRFIFVFLDGRERFGIGIEVEVEDGSSFCLPDLLPDSIDLVHA